jgi:hypothetical protein
LELPELRPPSLTEFNSAFNASVLQLIAEDKLNFVSTFGQAAEVKEIDCSAKLEQRETHLELEATGDPETITTDDISVLENVVESSLTDVFARFCDPQARTIFDVAFVSIRVQTD